MRKKWRCLFGRVEGVWMPVAPQEPPTLIPLEKPIVVRYNKFWRDKGYKWTQNIITFTHRGFFWSTKEFEPKGYTGHSQNGEEWSATESEIGSLFELLPVNPYLVEDEGRKEIRLARLRAEHLRGRR